MDGAHVESLTQDPVAFLCTVRPDGSAHQTPVWFVLLGPTWWIATAARNVKVGNVARDPRVSIAVPNAGSPAVAEGAATVHRRQWPDDVVAAFSAKYDGWDVTDNRPDGPRVLLSVATRRWLVPLP